MTATFGQTSKGTASDSLPGDTIRGSAFTCPEGGVAESITVYLEQRFAKTPKVKCALYKESDDSLVAYTEEWTLTSGWDDWKTFNIVWGGTLENIAYWIVVWADDQVTLKRFLLAGQDAWDAHPYNSWPEPLVPTEGTWEYSIYCTYSTAVVHEKEITEGIAMGETLIKQPIKNISEGVAMSEVLTKVITKAPFVEGIAIGEVLTKVQLHVREIIEGIAIGETVTKAVTKVITEGIAIGEVLVKMRVLRAIRNLLSVREQKAARQKDKERQL